MGNKSGSEFGGIMIRTEKSLYFAGDVVKRNIYFHIIKPDYHGNAFQSSIVEKEKTRWTTDSATQNHKLWEKCILSRHYENLIVGQFVFPFELHLPSSLPESFHYLHGILASLNYKVKARVISTSKSMNAIKNKQEIIIREPFKTANLTTWCCKKQGSSSIFAKVEKNLYFPGEFVQITYDIENFDCKLNIENVDVIILRNLYIQNQMHQQLIMDLFYILKESSHAKACLIQHLKIPIKSKSSQSFTHILTLIQKILF